MRTKIKVFKGKNKQWYFSLVARNGKIVAQSEGYTQRYNAVKTIEGPLEEIVMDMNIEFI